MIGSAERRWAGPLTIAAVCTALTVVGADALQGLRYDRSALAAGQWWRLIGCAVVHLNGWHLLQDLAGMLLLAAVAPTPWSAAGWAARLAVTSVGMSGILWWGWPRIGTYAGLSGPLYGLSVIALLPSARRGDLPAGMALAALASGIGLELAFGSPAAEERIIGGHVVAESHLAGLLAGLGWVVSAPVVRLVRRRR